MPAAEQEWTDERIVRQASFVSLRSDKPARSEERLFATAATVAASILGGAHIVRVHDVAEMAQVAAVTDRILDA